MALINILLGSGLLLSIVGWLVREGQHKERHNTLNERMLKVENKTDDLVIRVNEKDVQNATILTTLEYISMRVDELHQKNER